jgi:hypothetical protein
MSSPTITTQPQSQVVNTNSSATFTVVATSTLTITYQWYFNCVVISGATGSSLTINPVTSSNAGVYYVVVTNSAGSTQKLLMYIHLLFLMFLHIVHCL